MAKSIVSSPKVKTVPGAPYSPGTRAGNLVFVAGMLALDGNGQMVGRGDVGAQTRQVLENVKAIVEAAGGRLVDIVKTTVFITDMANFAAMNEVYKTYFPSEPPARSTIRADLVNNDFLVEIEAIAVLG